MGKLTENVRKLSPPVLSVIKEAAVLAANPSENAMAPAEVLLNALRSSAVARRRAGSSAAPTPQPPALPPAPPTNALATRPFHPAPRRGRAPAPSHSMLLSYLERGGPPPQLTSRRTGSSQAEGGTLKRRKPKKKISRKKYYKVARNASRKLNKKNKNTRKIYT